jgi:hypothetical protein
LYLYSRIVVTIAGACIVAGGLYDVCTPRLPPNLANKCFDNEGARIVVRELLRALGACLIAIGLTVGILETNLGRQHDHQAIALILTLVLPSEGMNAIGMHPVGSPYVAPLLYARDSFRRLVRLVGCNVVPR